MNSVLCSFFVIVFAVSCSADGIVYRRVTRPVIEEHLKPAPETEAERLTTLRAQFQKAGCPQMVEQPVPGEQSPNLICTVPGFQEGTILVCSSLAYEAEDAKMPARWSALTLLPLLVKSLVSAPHRSTFVFVAFPGREHGTQGASHYVSQLTEIQTKTLRAVVDLDNLGRTPPAYALAQSDKTLANWLEAAAHSLKLPVPPVLEASSTGPSGSGLPEIQTDDLLTIAKPFQQQHLPVIAIQSAPVAFLPALRSAGAIPERFTGTGFDLDAFDDTYRLVCIYILYLDGNLGRPPIKMGTYLGNLLATDGQFGARTIDMTIKVDRLTPLAEMRRLELILKKDGQEGLADALERSGDSGSYQFGTRLGTAFKLAVWQTTGPKPHVLLVAVRLKRVGANAVDDYRFEAVQLNVDDQGKGDALYLDSVRLRFNKDHELEIDDRRYMPDEIRQLKWEPPAQAKTKPAAK